MDCIKWVDVVGMSCHTNHVKQGGGCLQWHCSGLITLFQTRSLELEKCHGFLNLLSSSNV